MVLSTAQTKKKQKIIPKLTVETNLLDSIGDPFFVLDDNLCFIYLNKVAERIKLVTLEQVSGKCIWELNPKAIGGYVYRQYHKVLKTKQPLSFEALAISINRWYEYNVYPYQEGISVYLKDITDRKRLEEQLIQQEEQMRKQAELLDFTQDQILVRDMDDNIIYWNKGAEKGYGWSGNEAIGRNCRDLLKTQYPEPLALIIKELFENGYWRGQVQKTRKDGQQITLSSRWALMRDEHNKPKSILEINTDISEKQVVIAALEDSERRYKAVFNSLFSLISLIRTDGTRIETNRVALDFVGGEESAIKNSLFWEAPWWDISIETKNQIREAIFKAAQGNIVQFEAEILNANGKKATLDFSMKPVFNEIGEVVLLISEGRDLTEQKKLEQEMLRLDRLNVIGQAAAGISHEIRNPLTTVRGFLQILSEREKQSENAVYYNLMIGELDRANSIITEFLSLAKDKVVKKVVSNLNSIINAIYPIVLADAVKAEKNILFEPQDISDLLLDGKEIRQLIHNLIRNGLESMTAGGQLTIKTFEEENKVILSVQDQGSGIEQSVLDKLGTPFLTTKDNGTGLGLAVSFGIVARHNAKINVDTSPSGTTFYVRFSK